MAYSLMTLFIGILLGILIDKYLIPLCDMIIQDIANNKQCIATKQQEAMDEIERNKKIANTKMALTLVNIEKKIYDIRKLMKPNDTSAIGFNYGNQEMCDCEECNPEEYPDDCKSNTKIISKQIGFDRC